MTDYISGDYDSPNAPWNEEDIYCTECGSDKLEIDDMGSFKGIKWINYKCLECGEIINSEPNYE